MMVVDPVKMRRRARILRPLGILVTIAGGGLLAVGIFLLATDPFGSFDVFWMPFVGGFAMFPGILMWVAGNLARASAQYAASQPMVSHGLPGSPPQSFSVPGFRSCPSCGNANPASVRTCQVCGTNL